MKPVIHLLVAAAILAASTAAVSAQVDDICGEFGYVPSLDAPRMAAPYIYGKVAVTGIDAGSKLPKVSVVYLNRGQTPNRQTLGKSGSYCFRIEGGAGGTLVIDVDGAEVARRQVSNFGTAQQREDFEVSVRSGAAAFGVVSAKWSYPPNERTSELYRQAAAAEREKDPKQAITALKQIVEIDANDFIAWGMLGSFHLQENFLPDAEAAFRKALEHKVDYTPAWVNMGRIRMAQKQFEAAIGILKHATELDPADAVAFKLLGESYLETKQGTLGVAALKEAIKLDPIGMADSHISIALLYDRAGAKHLATAEYKALLAKIPDHPERKKMERYIKDNPEK
jgi:cytochrome c-type biogenesis protein CcmH/NrfG